MSRGVPLAALGKQTWPGIFKKHLNNYKLLPVKQNPNVYKKTSPMIYTISCRRHLLGLLKMVSVSLVPPG